MLHESYARKAINDSAALWLDRASLKRPETQASAVVFFQRTGPASKADSLLSALPPSFTRDTLAIRQRLFAADFSGAAHLAQRLAQTYPSSGAESGALLLWRIRSLLFCGKAGEAQALLDSVGMPPSKSGAGDIAAAAYVLEMVKNAPDAWGLFGSVAYASWLDRPDKVLAALKDSNLNEYDMRIRRTIVLTAIRTLMESRRFAQARAIMERTETALADGECCFYYGQLLYNEGVRDSAKKVLEAMLLDRPGDVFSERARLFLSRMNAGGRHGDSVDEKRHY
jgi:hypothetical protein